MSENKGLSIEEIIKRAEQIKAEAERQLGDLAEAYVLAQLERGFGALDYWKQLAMSN